MKYNSEDFTDEDCRDIICVALEGGIGYWCVAQNIAASADGGYESFDAVEYDGDRTIPLGEVGVGVIRRGLDFILTGRVHISSDIRNLIAHGDLGDFDAEIADCIVQAGILGEIRYS